MIERTVAIDISPEQIACVENLVAAVVSHIIVTTLPPYDLDSALNTMSDLDMRIVGFELSKTALDLTLEAADPRGSTA